MQPNPARLTAYFNYEKEDKPSYAHYYYDDDHHHHHHHLLYAGYL